MDVLDAPTGDRDDTDDQPVEHDTPTLTAHESRPGRTVLTEEGNPDAWIATDLTIDSWL